MIVGVSTLSVEFFGRRFQMGIPTKMAIQAVTVNQGG
jgi:hypothetical protein